MEKKNMSFQAEVKEILNLMVHSLYSQREIFMRELISNASDALDKLRFESLLHPEWNLTSEERAILLTPDSAERTLKIQDNGIGMSYDEVVKNIGTIAHSGTREFLRAQQEMKAKPELIGQFGVGFYSAFMVAEKVYLHTQKAGENQGTLWESNGDGEFTISSIPRPEGHGTTITIKLKDFSSEEGSQDFCDTWTLKGIIRKYSDFITYPVKIKKDNSASTDATKQSTVEYETVNSQKALWQKNPSEVKEEEYKEFYRHISHDWSEPLRSIHFKAEGTQEFSALMYIPKEAPFDYNQRETKHGLSLYIKRVFIMANCEDVQPQYLRFIKGLVDSSDLSLNVSREILQKDPQVSKIQKALVAKVLGYLKDMMSKDRKDYETFWGKFGATLKEGVVVDSPNRAKIADLLLFRSTDTDAWTSLSEYVSRMKPDQKSIYYLSGDSDEVLKNSPYLERLRAKDYEVLLLTDTVDEWVTRDLKEFEGKKLISISGDELDIETEDERKAMDEQNKEADAKFGDLKKFIEKTLSEQVKEVRYSSRLVDSPVCLVSQGQDPTARMARILEGMGQEMKPKRILEINPQHPIFEKILKLNDSHKNEWIEILYNQALLNEGSPIKDPVRFSKQISSLMVDAQV